MSSCLSLLYNIPLAIDRIQSNTANKEKESFTVKFENYLTYTSMQLGHNIAHSTIELFRQPFFMKLLCML